MIVYAYQAVSSAPICARTEALVRELSAPDDLLIVADGQATRAHSWDEFVAAARQRRDCEALVVVDDPVRASHGDFRSEVRDAIVHEGNDVVVGTDGTVIALSPQSLDCLDLGGAADLQSLGIVELVVSAVRRAGGKVAHRRWPIARDVGVRAACGLCGGQLDRSLPVDGYAIASCEGCGVGVTLPAPQRDITSDGIWEEQYGGQRLAMSAQWFKEAALRLDWIETRRRHGTLLDIGCGSGELVSVAAERGFKAIGVEPTPTGRAATAERVGASQVVDDLSNWPIDQPVDVVTLMHVLEHVHEPLPFLAQIRDTLRERGLLFVEVPNFASAAAQRDPLAWTGSALSDHVFHYTPASLARVMNTAGFDVLSVFQMPTMMYDTPEVFAAKCVAWHHDGYPSPPDDLLRMVVRPATRRTAQSATS